MVIGKMAVEEVRCATTDVFCGRKVKRLRGNVLVFVIFIFVF